MNLFIGISSSDTVDKKYIDDSKIFLEKVLKENDLVFGACDNGLMGLAYRIAKENGRKVIGVCPELYKDDLKAIDCDEEIIKPTNSSRAEEAIKISDAIIIMPGGIGSIFEFFNAFESSRNHEMNKPIIVYNPFGFYDKLLEVLQDLVTNNFAHAKYLKYFTVVNSAEEALNIIKESYEG